MTPLDVVVDHGPEPEPADQAAGPVDRPGSLLERLRAQAAAQQQRPAREFPVGGQFGEWLWLRCEPIPPAQLDSFMAKRQAQLLGQRGSSISLTETNADFLCAATVAVIGRDPADPGAEQLLSDETGPVRIEHRLALLLGMPVPPGPELSGRDVCLLLFGGNGIALAARGDDVFAWMSDPAAASERPGKPSGAAG